MGRSCVSLLNPFSPLLPLVYPYPQLPSLLTHSLTFTLSLSSCPSVPFIISPFSALTLSFPFVFTPSFPSYSSAPIFINHFSAQTLPHFVFPFSLACPLTRVFFLNISFPYLRTLSPSLCSLFSPTFSSPQYPFYLLTIIPLYPFYPLSLSICLTQFPLTQLSSPPRDCTMYIQQQQCG